MSPQWILDGATWYLYRCDPYLSRADKIIFQSVRWSESAGQFVDIHGATLGTDLDEAKTTIEKWQWNGTSVKIPPQYDWAIQSIVDGKETDRIIECKTEAEARDWVKRFPQSYLLLSRESAGAWSKASNKRLI